MSISTPQQFVVAYQKHGGLKAVHRATGTGYRKTQRLYTEAVAAGLMEPIPLGTKRKDHRTAILKGQVSVKPSISGSHAAVKIEPLPLKNGKVTRFLLTCAQNNTKINEAFWNNLLALKDHYDATLLVSYFSYDKNSLGARGDKAKWLTNPNPGPSGRVQYWFDERLHPYVANGPRRIANGLVWCGEQNILPTAARPLSTMESMTGRDSAIIPHVKTAMESVAAAKGEATKFLYTTGTVTQRNYIMRKEGRKADFHHSYGALLVEVDEHGSWWARQIIGDQSGTIYDVNTRGTGCIRVFAGKITTGHRAEAITWGDIHVAQMDQGVRKLAFGKGGMLDSLRPKYQFLHDTLDFYSRNHHDIEDEFAMLERHATGRDSVSREVSGAGKFFDESARPWCESVVVNSNHDRALMRWLRDSRAKHDPVNMRFRCAMRDRLADAVEAGRPFIAFREAYLYVTGHTAPPSRLRFLDEDESFLICGNAGNGIEMGMHGDRGPNGARGSRLAFTKMGRRAVIGHSHSAGITDGVYQTGTCSILNPVYNVGPSSWSHSHVVVYPSGKRAIVTMWRGKWHA